MKTSTKRWGLLAALVIVAGISTYAQPYTTALGIRVGETTGLTLKHNYERNMALEGILGFFRNGVSLTGLMEIHRQAYDVQGLRWYYGPGAHIAFYNSGYRGNRWRDRSNYYDSAVGFGINGIVGMEYRLPDDVPIVFSFELKPFLEIDTSGNAGFALDPGLGVKFILK